MHEEVKALLRRVDMSAVTIADMMDRLEELGMETTFDSRETSILAMLVHMKNMLKEFTYRRREGTITVEETAEVCEVVLRRFTDSYKTLFTDDLFSQTSSFCRLSRGITSVLREMKTNVERNHYYRNFSGMYGDHVAQITSGAFDLRTYRVIVAVHNLHAAIQETLADRLDALREFDGSVPFFEPSPKDEFSLRIVWNNAQDSFKLQEVKKEGEVQSVIFHSSFLKIVNPSSAQEWRNRRRLGPIDLSIAHSCSVCFRDDVPTSELTVLSGCIHVFCTNCIEGWFDSSRSRSCPCCRTVSEERIMASGYRNLLRMIR